MSKEIERKFLVIDNEYKSMACSEYKITQGYLSDNPDSTVRVRIKDNNAFLTVKSKNIGAVRNEWEYEVPKAEAEEMILKCKLKCLEKTRYIVPFDGHKWEVDEFHGLLSGLVIAEIELNEINEDFYYPPFIGKEITLDPAYYNSSLVKKLYI